MAHDSGNVTPQLLRSRPFGPDGVWLLLAAVVLTSMAAGMGWGIRGQYGHESGAMIAGTLAALTLVMLFVPRAVSINGARAAAMMATAIGIGGSMTYGQTVGLTHDHEIIGNSEAWRWGMLGLLIKGGVWIGFGGFFLGIGLSSKRYRAREMTLMLAAAMGLYFVGVWAINSPFAPFNSVNPTLPVLYFSDHWYFEPERFEAGLIKPRWETFGGYWMALIGLTFYARLVRGDKLALRMAVVGVIGGGLGFPGGQSVQSANAWYPEWFQEGGAFGFGELLFRSFNWWNVMETTFGAIWGAVMACGLWFNRHLIDVSEPDDHVSLSAPVELLLAVMYLTLMLAGDFEYLNPLKLPVEELQYAKTHPLGFASYWFVEIGILMVSLPLIGIAGGRMLPYLMPLVLIAVPICGKTLRAVGSDPDPTSIWADTGRAWFSLVQIPLMCAVVIAAWLIQNHRGHTAGRFAGISLSFTVMTFFGLNSVLFGFPRLFEPLEKWGGRHPNQAFFMISCVFLVVASVITLLVIPGHVRKGARRRRRG